MWCINISYDVLLLIISYNLQYLYNVIKHTHAQNYDKFTRNSPLFGCCTHLFLMLKSFLTISKTIEWLKCDGAFRSKRQLTARKMSLHCKRYRGRWSCRDLQMNAKMRVHCTWVSVVSVPINISKFRHARSYEDFISKRLRQCDNLWLDAIGWNSREREFANYHLIDNMASNRLIRHALMKLYKIIATTSEEKYSYHNTFVSRNLFFPLLHRVKGFTSL